MNIEDILISCRDKKVYLYGAGLYGRTATLFLEEQGVDVEGYIVTDRDTAYRNNVLGRPVYTLSDIGDRISDKKIIVSAGSKYAGEMVENLRLYGVMDPVVISEELFEYMDRNTEYSIEHDVKKNVMVLLYHRVIDIMNDPQLLSVSTENFDKQIKYIKSKYRVLRFEDDWSDVNEKSVVITFDDGYFDNYKYALPILESHEVPATFFICSGNIDTNREFWWDDIERLILLNDNLPQEIVIDGESLKLDTDESLLESYYRLHTLLKSMTPEKRDTALDKLENELCPSVKNRSDYRSMTSSELLAFSKSRCVTIGGHTVTHTRLSNESNGKQKWEIEESKKQVEKYLSKPIETFSYPFGNCDDYTQQTIEILKKVGYRKAASNYPGIWDPSIDGMEIPRNLIRNWSVEEFARNLNKIWDYYGA